MQLESVNFSAPMHTLRSEENDWRNLSASDAKRILLLLLAGRRFEEQGAPDRAKESVEHAAHAYSLASLSLFPTPEASRRPELERKELAARQASLNY